MTDNISIIKQDDDDKAIPLSTQKDVGNQLQLAIPKEKVGPKCTQDCPAHSTCIADELCQCNDGYIESASKLEQGFSCKPYCSQSCPTDAECVAPNVCKCLPGYEKTKHQDMIPDKEVEICSLSSQEDKIEWRSAKATAKHKLT